MTEKRHLIAQLPFHTVNMKFPLFWLSPDEDNRTERAITSRERDRMLIDRAHGMFWRILYISTEASPVPAGKTPFHQSFAVVEVDMRKAPANTVQMINLISERIWEISDEYNESRKSSK